MIIVDVETSGIDERRHPLIAIGAVDYREPYHLFSGTCRLPDWAGIDPTAPVHNGLSEEQIRNGGSMELEELIASFLDWCADKPKLLLAHNADFDRRHLLRAAELAGLAFPFNRRTIDLHTVCYMHMITHAHAPPRNADGSSALSLDTIGEYVGMAPEPRPHTARAGALYVADAYHRLMVGRPLVRG